MPPIQLIVGLGNPGSKYAHTRHNAGFWFVDEWARATGSSLKQESKFHGEVVCASVGGADVWLLKPQTYMNRSGQAVHALTQFYKIEIDHILVVHDELDIAPGAVRVKQGGGHAGHNGLRDIIAQMGGNDFTRLRIGIGRPATSGDVTDYVLGPPAQAEREAIDAVIKKTQTYLPLLVAGEIQKAMNHLHSIAPPSSSES